MSKRILLAIVAVFLAWGVMDFVLHGKILQSIYVDTAHMWRPMEEMNIRMMYLVSLISASAFVLIYVSLTSNRSVKLGVLYGFLFGLASGVSAGFASYCLLPIPIELAWGWFLGMLAEATVGGAITGAIIKPNAS